MATGAFFEPKALRGSTSGRPVADCGADGSEAALATITGAGMTGGLDSAEELTLSGPSGVCANGCVDGETGSGVLCKDGRKRAQKPSKPTLRIPARMRRRFTRSSQTVLVICPTIRNSTSKPGQCKSPRDTEFIDRPRKPSKAGSLGLVAEQAGSVVQRILVNHNRPTPSLFVVSVASKGLSVLLSGLESTLTGTRISVASKRVRQALNARRSHFGASVDYKGVAGQKARKRRPRSAGANQARR